MTQIIPLHMKIKKSIKDMFRKKWSWTIPFPLLLISLIVIVVYLIYGPIAAFGALAIIVIIIAAILLV